MSQSGKEFHWFPGTLWTDLNSSIPTPQNKIVMCTHNNNIYLWVILVLVLTKQPSGRGMNPIRRDTKSQWSALAWMDNRNTQIVPGYCLSLLPYLSMTTCHKVFRQNSSILPIYIRTDVVELGYEGMLYPVHNHLRHQHQHKYWQHWNNVFCDDKKSLFTNWPHTWASLSVLNKIITVASQNIDKATSPLTSLACQPLLLNERERSGK